jgi:nucleoside-diphosphate-sugar epimerase
MKMKTIFMTGVTGYVGCHLAYEALMAGHRVVALARDAGNSPAHTRVQNAIQQVNPDATLPTQNIYTVTGDVRDSGEQMVANVHALDLPPVTDVWHCAATFLFQEQDREQVEAINIQGVGNMLDFVRLVNGEGKSPRYFHVGTAYSSGKGVSVVPEALVHNTAGFRSLYEWSKHQGEHKVADMQAAHGLDATIFRPAIIVGSPETHVFNHAAYYQVASALYRMLQHSKKKEGANYKGELAIRLLGNPETPLNFVPITFVIDAMLRASEVAELATPSLKFFNITNDQPPSVGLVHNIVCQSLGITGLELVSPEAFEAKPMNRFERALSRNVTFQMPYMFEDIRFDTSRFRQYVSRDVVPDPVIDAEFLGKINGIFFAELDKRL